MQLCLITPPMTQVNSPYPATAYLSSYLRKKGISVSQFDLGLDLFLQLFSVEGLREIHQGVLENLNRAQVDQRGPLEFFLDAFPDYLATVEPTVAFLQGKDSSLALRISSRTFLPEGPRFAPLHEYEKKLLAVYGSMGIQDKAKYLASLYLDDIADIIQLAIDPYFAFSRYGETLSSSQVSFTPLYEQLRKPQSRVAKMLLKIFSQKIREVRPDVVGFSVPFPGNLYSSLIMAQELKQNHQHTKVVMGGGFVNTELRKISDRRFFEFIDYLIYDDGEKPLENLIEFLQGKRSGNKLLRTKFLLDDKIEYVAGEDKDIAFKDNPGPDFSGLPLKSYVSMVELPNPMFRLWTDFRWNKMIAAHGCYWHRCTFCDVHLDYIKRFEPAQTAQLVDQFERIIEQTGSRGFHFVDEALPPALIRQFSQEIIKRNLKITWWGNLRFDTQFDQELTYLMSEAGCVAVTGGLEVASPRILDLINKGITVEQVARVTHNFFKAKIFVHAYLMYGFPTQTVQETIDSLEVVRQLFLNKCLQSAHWHRFLTTVHSPVGKEPEKFAVILQPRNPDQHGLFAEYEIPFVEMRKTKVDLDMLGNGLRKALYNYMHGLGLNDKVEVWFEKKVPQTSLASDLIKKAISTRGKT